MSVGIRRLSINTLCHGSNDFLLVAIIINKQSPRTIISKNDGTRRCVWTFTLRDSPADYINVSYWGTPEFITGVAGNFHIGDVVDIVKAKVQYRKNEDSNYMPDVTSPLNLTMNQDVAEMCLHPEDDCAEFHRLLRLPTRPPSDYLTLSDVHSNGQALRGKHVNIFVAVKSVGAIRQVTTKAEGKELECREVEVMDQSPTFLYIQMWDSEVIFWADNWKPCETILFMADVRLDWSAFKKNMTATVTSRTIITENPSLPYAKTLREYARTAPTRPTAILDQLATRIPDPASINTVMSCQAIWKKAVGGDSADSFTALVYGAVTGMDLDGLIPLTITKCHYCQHTVDESIGLCINADCAASCGLERPLSDRVYDVRVTFSDHTGSLPKCHITSAAVTQALKCKPEEFDCLSLEAKTHLKWQYLFKTCSARIVILPSAGHRPSPLFSIVAIEKAQLTECAAHMPMC